MAKASGSRTYIRDMPPFPHYAGDRQVLVPFPDRPFLVDQEYTPHGLLDKRTEPFLGIH